MEVYNLTSNIKRGLKWLEKNYPIEYNEVDKAYNIDILWVEKLYLYSNNLTTPPKCYCGNKVKLINSIKGYNTYCSRKCKATSILEKEKTKNTVSKFSAEKIAEIKKKTDDTILLKYGVDNVSKSDFIKNKKKQTSLKNYGVEYYTKTNEAKSNLSINLKNRQTELQILNKKLIEEYWINKFEKFNLNLINRINNTFTFKCDTCNNDYTISKSNLNDRIRSHDIICTVCNPIINRFRKITNFKEFVNAAILIHKDKYIYIDYINKSTKATIYCKKCDKNFKQLPSSHLNYSGCPTCCNNISFKEIKWLDSLNIELINRQISIKINNKNYIVDALVNNAVYEFYGDYWHGNPEVYSSDQINKTLNKTFGELYQKTLLRENILKENGYIIISIFEKYFNI